MSKTEKIRRLKEINKKRAEKRKTEGKINSDNKIRKIEEAI